MIEQKNFITLLSDLVKINNDRIEEYKKAVASTEDVDLKALFQRMIEESMKNKAELNQQILKHTENAARETNPSGHLFHTCLNAKTAFIGSDRREIFSSCEYEEEVIQYAYNDALHCEIPMPYYIREIIVMQQAHLKEAYNTIKSFQDVERFSHN